MNIFIDKLVIFLITLALYIPNANTIYMIGPVLIVIFLTAILNYLENQHVFAIIFAAYIVLCFFVPTFSYFIPMICYDIAFLKPRGLWILSFTPLLNTQNYMALEAKWLIASFILLSYILRSRTVSIKNFEKEYRNLRDTAKEISIQLEKQNKELFEKQDYEVNLATVTERNRIARDIHDNVGHLLSRSILQVGAILAIHKDKDIKESLHSIKNTLSEAMDSIRNNVHNLHEKSIDLYTEIHKLTDAFTFCHIKFNYDIESNLDKNMKYCFIAVTKEALSNIIKHSNATEASVSMREHPAFYQLVIQDNGSTTKYNIENGIGLKNITDRVAAIDGNVNITNDHGFKIFISIPKKYVFERTE